MNKIEFIYIIIGIFVFFILFVFFISKKFAVREIPSLNIRGEDYKLYSETGKMIRIFEKANLLTKDIRKYLKVLRRYEKIVKNYGIKEDLAYFMAVKKILDDLEVEYEDRKKYNGAEFYEFTKELFNYSYYIMNRIKRKNRIDDYEFDSENIG